MRFMMIVKATRHSEAGIRPAPELADAMTKYYEELANAGVLLAAEGLYPSSRGMRISYPVPGDKPRLAAGPFGMTLAAGFALIEVKSEDEAYEWAVRMPDPHGFGEGEIELRQVLEAPEFVRDPNKLAMEADLRDQLDMLKKR